tara:strand:- start:905 stop:1069 length:165 start_codon:yes stop_codon:yes gene_type:complete
MNFKIPPVLLYLGIGINIPIFFMGITLGRWDISLLAILSSMLLLFPILFNQEED